MADPPTPISVSNALQNPNPLYISMPLIQPVENASTLVASSTAVRRQTFDEAFADFEVQKDLANAGMSTSQSSDVLKSVSGSSSGKTYTYSGVEGTFKPGDTVIIDGRRSTVLEDGTLEDEGIDVTGNRGESSSATDPSVDSRLRISALAGREENVYGPNNPNDNILAPLYSTGGLLFPYTPSLAISGEASWSAHELVHTNFDILSYQRTPSATIGITGKFTVQNQREGEYALAVIHFLRTMTKMHYGHQESMQNNAEENKGAPAIAGLPPPTLRLRGYGNFMFPDLRCVIRGYSFNFEENMDLVPITSPANGMAMLPPLFSIQVTIGLQQSPRRIRKDFNLEEFRTGRALSQGGNWF